jgi:branched-chain amino acid transport system ATP-binding protein
MPAHILQLREVSLSFKGIQDEGLSILVAEQNSTVALRHADRATVIENGRTVLEGAAQELRARDDVKAFHPGLGTPHREASGAAGEIASAAS